MGQRRRVWLGVLATTLAVLVSVGCKRQSPAAALPQAQVTVFAAASTVDVMREAGTRFEKQRGVKVVFSFDASSSLAKQIKAGAPADVFLSADEAWMDEVAGGAKGRESWIVPGTRQDLLGSQLVLIAPKGKRFEAQLVKDFDFANRLPDVKRIAVGDPTHVPAGKYARAALETLGWWGSLQSRIVPALDTRAALRLVEMQEADAGIVYATDAKASAGVEVVATFGAGLHDPIRYPVAVCRGGVQPKEAAAFLEFLRSPEMRSVFEGAGFVVISPIASTEPGR